MYYIINLGEIMKFTKIILIALLLLTIFTISAVSANSNASDTISTEQDNDELKTSEVESGNVEKYAENDTDEEFSSNLIGQSEDNLLSKHYDIRVKGNTTIEKGEIAKFTIDSGWSDSGEVNIDIIDFKGKTCFNFPNYGVSNFVSHLEFDTSNLIAGEYGIYVTVANLNDSIYYFPTYFYVTDSEAYGSYSPEKVLIFGDYLSGYTNNDNVIFEVTLQDYNNNIISRGYVDVFIDGVYNKRLNINHANERLNLGKLKAGKHNITLKSCYYSQDSFIITIIKDSNPKSTVKTTIKAPTVTAYYKANKYFKVSVKKGGKAVKNLKLNVKVYTGSKYKNYIIKTNKNGVAIFSTKKFKIGSHKVKITSKNTKYKVSKTSKIVIKKKSNIKKVTIKIPEPNPYPNKKKLKTGDTLYAINSLGPQYGKGVYAQVINMGQRIHTKILKVKFYFENEYTGKIKTKIVTKIRNYNRYDGGESTAYTKFIPDYIPYKATVWYKKI